MEQYIRFLCAGTALCFFLVPTATHAAGVDKVDRMLKKAIIDTAAEAPPVVVPEPVTPEPVIDAEAAPEEAAIEEPEPATEEVAAEPAIESATPDNSLGFALGNMLWLPSLTLEQRYDDNIQADDSDEEGDYISVIRPALHGEIIDSEHGLAVDLSYETRQFWENSDENIHDFNAGLEGHVQGSVIQLPYKLSYVRGHEERTEDLTRQLPEEPIETETFLAEAGMRYQPAKIGFLLLGRIIQEKFDDNETPANVLVVRHDADRETWEGEGGVSYEFMPGQRFSVGALYGARNYERRNFEAGGFNGVFRDSDHYAGWVGWEADYKGVVFGDMRLGYEERDYEAGALENVSGLLADAEANWNISDVTSLKFDFSHGHYEDDEVIQPIIRTTGGIRIEQKLWDKFILGAGGEYDRDDFEGSGREDETLLFRALLDYLMNERFSLGAEYNYSTRDSTTAGFDYDRNVWFLRVTGRL